MNYRALKTLIDATPECAGKTAAEVASILNQPRANQVVTPDIPRRTVLRVLAGRGIISKLYDGARNIANSHQIRSICFALEAVINAAAEGIDTSDPGNTQMMGALVTASIITQADSDALIAASKRTGSLVEANADKLGASSVTEGDCRNAMTSF